MGYPAEPWSLRGQMHVSVFVLPVDALPPVPEALHGAVRVVRAGRRAFVGAAWVDYQPGGDMAYRELLAATLMRAGLRPRVTISHIWVDSADSRDGGRELWGIPKDLASFDFSDGTARADGIAAAALAPKAGLPVRLPAGFTVTQDLDGAPRSTPVRSTARYRLARVEWTVDPAGPLAFLAGRRPLLSFTAADFRMRFGRRRESPRGRAARSGPHALPPSPASS